MEKMNIWAPNRPENETPSFEKQFENIQHLDSIDYVNIEDKANVKNKVFFAPGWARPMTTFKETLEALYKQGRNVTSLNHPRLGWDKMMDNESEVPKEALRRATSIKKVLLHEFEAGNKKIDIIAQSVGALDALTAAIDMEN
jgi:hypothetical protein